MQQPNSPDSEMSKKKISFDYIYLKQFGSLMRLRLLDPLLINSFLKKIRDFSPILALGAESNSSFAYYNNSSILYSSGYGNTFEYGAFSVFKKRVLKFINYIQKKDKKKISLVLADMHPEYNVSAFAEGLSRKLGARLVKIQHHLSHAYSAALEFSLARFSSIVCDGLGYGSDNTLWGGEVFYNAERIGHLEQHKQIGGDSAALYPAKMLVSILSNIMDPEKISLFIRDYYSLDEIRLLIKQKKLSYNCPLTSSAGRVLDAASFMLGFCNKKSNNESPAVLLDKNASSSYGYGLEPVIKNNVLMTTPLFRFLAENINKSKSRLAATVLEYIALGLYKIASQKKTKIVFSGGCANSKVMSNLLKKKSVLITKRISCSDAGISLGQISCFLANSRHYIS